MNEQSPKRATVAQVWVRAWAAFVLGCAPLVLVDGLITSARVAGGVFVLPTYLTLGWLSAWWLAALVACTATVPMLAASYLLGAQAPSWRRRWGGGLAGLLVGAGGLPVMRAHEIHDPYHLDLLLLCAGPVLGFLVAEAFSRGRPLVVGALGLALALSGVVVDAYYEQSHFEYLHRVLAYGTVMAAWVAMLGLHERWASRRGLLLGLGLAGVVGHAVLLVPTEGARSAAAFHGALTPKLMGATHALVDFDRDGHSPLPGGGDCDDADAQRYPHACELPDNGIDDNCNGLVDGAASRAPGADVARRAGPRPDIYLVLVDTLRADYGGETPEVFQKLGASSLSFSQAYTTYPTTFQALTSLAQGVHWRHVDAKRPNLFRLLADAGYAMTLLHDTRRAGLKEVRGGAFTGDEWTRLFVNLDREHKNTNTERLVGEVLDAAQARGAEHPPHLTWLHLDDPHYPRRRLATTEPDPKRYRVEVEHVAAQLERLLEGLEGSARGRDAIVVVFGDHGEEFGEHGATMHGGHLYEESIHVPMFVRLPGEPARTIDEVASTLDLMPTLLHALELPRPAGLEGRDWLEVPGTGSEVRVLAQIQRSYDSWSGSARPNQVALRGASLKLIADVDRGVHQLFDLEDDPEEQRDVSVERASEAEPLLEALARWQDRADCRDLTQDAHAEP